MWNFLEFVSWENKKKFGEKIKKIIEKFLFLSKAKLKKCWVAITQLGLQETCGSKIFFDAHLWFFFFLVLIYYPSYAYPGNRSKLLTLFPASFFSCLCCFDFSYSLSSEQISQDCTKLAHQINRWKPSTAATENTNDEENFQIWIEL